MTEVWVEIFIKNEGGYEIILKSLEHYKKRLKTISKSPELTGAGGMFASVLNQQAMKTIPEIDQAIQNVKNFLIKKVSSVELKKDLELIKKSLACYQSDILKAGDTGNQYFLDLFKNKKNVSNDLPKIKEAMEKIF